MDGTGKYYIKWGKPGSDGLTLRALSHCRSWSLMFAYGLCMWEKMCRGQGTRKGERSLREGVEEEYITCDRTSWEGGESVQTKPS